MRQLKERITHSFVLEPMVRDDVESYVDFRMRAAGYKGPKVFSAAAIRLISRSSEGLTRRINILADKSLLAAFAGNTHGVTEKEAKAAIRDSDFFTPQSNRQKYLIAATLSLGAMLGWGMHWLAGSTDKPGPAAASPPRQEARSDQATAVPGTPDTPPTSNPAAPLAAPSQMEAETIKPPPQNPPLAAPVPHTAVKTNAAPEEKTATLPANLGKLTLARFQLTQEWLDKAPPGHHAVQLLTVKAEDARRMENFLQRAAKVVKIDDLWVYSVKIDGNQHYRVAYGQYPTSSDSKAAIEDLPQILKSQNPYPRSIERMRSQNRQ
jgi:septal ring-binding cell division protein DamX